MPTLTSSKKKKTQQASNGWNQIGKNEAMFRVKGWKNDYYLQSLSSSLVLVPMFMVQDCSGGSVISVEMYYKLKECIKF